MSIALYRLDDRLIHGQCRGLGKPLNVGFIVLVDDAVRASAWEQELYRMGVPPEIEVVFASTEEALEQLPEWERDPASASSSRATSTRCGAHRQQPPRGPGQRGRLAPPPGRSERLRYVYLTDAEAAQLKTLAARESRSRPRTCPPLPGAARDFT